MKALGITLLGMTLLSCSTGIVRDPSFLYNGGFDEVLDQVSPRDKPVTGWEVETNHAVASVQELSGIWRRCTVTFNSLEFNRITLSFGLYSWPSGRCWIDNLRANGFTFKNASFEQGFEHWSTDGPGKWTFLSRERAVDGEQSVLCFARANDASMIRFYQTVDVAPQTDYSYTFDLYAADDFHGAIRSSGMSVQPIKNVRVPCGETPMDEAFARRAVAGRRTVELSLQGGRVSLWQEASVPVDRHLQARVMVKPLTLDGQIQLRVEDTTNGALLAESSSHNEKQNQWQQLSVRFVSPSDDVRVVIRASGKGQAVVDNVDLSSPVLVPPVQQVTWGRAEKDFHLGASLTVSVEGASGEILKTGVEMLSGDLVKLADITLERSHAAPGQLHIQIGSGDTPKKGPESYALRVDNRSITIRAGHERGAFYGLMTLLQLLSRGDDDQPVAIACEILDWPDLPWREVTRPSGALIEQFARLKYNMLTRIAVSQLEEYRRHAIEPVWHLNITDFNNLKFVLPAAWKQGYLNWEGGLVSDSELGEYRKWYHGEDGERNVLSLAELEPQELFAKGAAALVKKYRLNYLACHVSEEPDWIGADPRSKATGRTPSQLLARLYERIDKAVKQANPKCRLVSWADNFPGGSTRTLFPDILPLLPKDMILINWAYHGSVSASGLKAAQLYHRHGLSFVACPWYDPDNIRQWCQIAGYSRDQGWTALGVRNYGGAPPSVGLPPHFAITETAVCSWRLPHKGEDRWVPLPLDVIEWEERSTWESF